MLSRLHSYFIAPYRAERVTRYQISDPRLTGLAGKTIAFLSDLHASTYFMPKTRVARIVETVNALSPDLVLLGGDYQVDHHRLQRPIPLETVASELARLSAPLGIYGVLGNHDWWDDPASQEPPHICETVDVFARHGIKILQNAALEIVPGLWLSGLDSQAALKRPQNRHQGLHDLPAAYADIPPGAPAILLAHEPAIFDEVPPNTALTLSGHTHAGQVQFFGNSPITPSHSGAYVYGRYESDTSQLIVSAGLGCSAAPLRFGVIPEIVLIEVNSHKAM